VNKVKEVMPKLIVYDIEGKESGSLDLPIGFDEAVNQAVIHQAVVMYQANERQGTADTKVRSEVSGSTRKPFRQKGTGRARQGSTRSPLLHHGGVVFGPHPRDFGYTIPKKARIVALGESLKSKYKGNNLVCVDPLTVTAGKTKEFLAILKALNIGRKKVVVLADDCAKEVLLACRNIPSVKIVKAVEVNALDILKNNKVLANKASIEKILKRLQ